MEYYRGRDSTQGDIEAARKRLERQLERERDLYRWGDLTEGEYKRRRDEIRKQLVQVGVNTQIVHATSTFPW